MRPQWRSAVRLGSALTAFLSLLFVFVQPSASAQSAHEEVPARQTASGTTGASGGPALVTSTEELDKSLVCRTPKRVTQRPVLLITGFGTDPREDFSWSYWKLLPAQGHPVCMIDFPEHQHGDEQTNVEYVIHGIRTMAARHHAKVTTLSHSIGGVLPIWALHFWPDMAAKVDDVISMGTPFQGTLLNKGLCMAQPNCQPALWQNGEGSRFLRALHKKPLPEGPSYTVIYGEADQLVQPAGVATHLAGAANIGLQSVCPGRMMEHHMLSADSVVYALVQDAIKHRGAAVPERVPASVCDREGMPGFAMPGIDMKSFEKNYFTYVMTPYTRGVGGPRTTAEPPLRPYAESVLDEG